MTVKQPISPILCLVAFCACVDLKKPKELICSPQNPCIDYPKDSGFEGRKDIATTFDLPGPALDTPDTFLDGPDANGSYIDDAAPGEATTPGKDAQVSYDAELKDTVLFPGDTVVGDRAPLPPDSKPDGNLPSLDTPPPDIPPLKQDTDMPLDRRVPIDSKPPVDTESKPPEPNCPTVIVHSGGSAKGQFGKAGYCLVTCDDFAVPYFGWDCTNFAGRTLKLNGQSVLCGQANLPAKIHDRYLFEVSAGSNESSVIFWWNQKSNATCPVPDGGAWF